MSNDTLQHTGAARHPRRFLLAMAACALLAPAAFAAAPRGGAAAVEAANRRFEENARKGDIERLIRDYYSDGSVVAFGGPEVHGVEAAKEAWEEMLEKGHVTLRTEKLETSPGMVAEMGRWTLHVAAEEHDFREESGRYFVVWRPVNGKWKAVLQFFDPEGFREAD